MIFNLFKRGLILLCLVVSACEKKSQVIDVQIYGELKNIMHGGAREGLVNIDDVVKDKNIYGVGALEGLDGEILLWNSKSILTRAQKGGEASVSMSPENEKALLLVTASVAEWIDIPFNGEDLTISLNDFIFEMAKKNHINADEPFPFILDGIFSKVKWHIISDPGPDGTHDDHMNKSWNQTDQNINGNILGFYSTKHHTVFTHHSTNSHMHFYNEISGLSGHVDALEIGEKVVLRLPK